MASEILENAAGKIRDLKDWIRSESVEKSIRIEDYEYQFDLGDFGYQTAQVTVEDDYYPIDVEDVFEDAPVSFYELDEIADMLDAFEPEQEAATLDSVLTRMEEGENENERVVARAVRAVVDVLREQLGKATAIVMGPLPVSPLPWPGALRTDIDYTATDFPLRYQPPPGWVWSGTGDDFGRVDYKDAVSVDATDLKTRKMVIDRKGRVSWLERGDDDLTSGVRWLIWTGERDGIPEGNLNFSTGNPPCPLDEDGLVMPDKALEGSDRGLPLWNWKTESVRDIAVKRLRELRGFDYDPLTVELGPEMRCLTTQLRVGDMVNSFGRVLAVKQNEDRYDLEYINSRGDQAVETREEFNWYMRPIVTVNGVARESRPTALSLSKGAPGGFSAIDYDPLTVPVTRVNFDRVPVDQLRLGDDITGRSFGRLIEVRETSADQVVLVMNRDGRQNTYPSSKDGSWDVEQIDVPNRDEVPTALQLAGIAGPAVPAPF